jgi:hypothetical protein
VPRSALGRPLSGQFTVLMEGQRVPLLAEFDNTARNLDRNRDKVLTFSELAGAARNLPGDLRVDLDDFAAGMAHELTGTPSRYTPHYPSALQIEETLQELARAYPSKLSLLSLGVTAEGRPLLAARVRTEGKEARPRVAIIAQQHAREWMAHQVALASLRALLEDPANGDLLSELELWVVPLANPDGYEYSRGFELMWRKNRGCGSRGVDLNRNFEFDFRRSGDQPDSIRDDWGASDNPSSQLFRGEHAGSEVETRCLQQLLDLPGMIGALDLHGFGCKIILPNETLVNDRMYQSCAQAIMEALGAEFEVLRYRELYPITGHLAAYADSKGAVGITLEVGRAFQPHPSKIDADTANAVPGVIAFLRSLLDSRREDAMP